MHLSVNQKVQVRYSDSWFPHSFMKLCISNSRYIDLSLSNTEQNIVVKTLIQNLYEGDISQHHKIQLWQIHKFILKGEKFKVFLKSGARLGWPLMPHLLNIILEALATAIREEKIKPSNWKGRNETVTVSIWHDTINRKS